MTKTTRLSVMMMANDGMQREIEFEKPRISKHNNNSNNDENQATTLVTFERGRRMQSRFTFKLATESNYNVKYHRKKVQTLRIEFIE